MKIKGNSAVTLKKAGGVSLALFAVLFVIRLYQVFAITDGATGFFTSDNISVALMYVFSVAAVVVTCALFYVAKGLPSGDVKKKPSFLYVVAGCLFAFSLIWDSVKNITVFFGETGGFQAQKEAVGGNVGLVSMIFGVLGGLSVLAGVAVYLRKGSLSGKLKIPMLFPVIWAFVECLSFFSITVSYVKVAGLLLAIFSAAFLMIFLFENARVITGIGKKDALWFFFATGFITAGLSLVSGIPNMLVSLFAPEKAVSYCPFELYAVTGGIYALASMLVRDDSDAEDADLTKDRDTLTDSVADGENNFTEN